jgi:hypothetical protein
MTTLDVALQLIKAGHPDGYALLLDLVDSALAEARKA